jgi:hypothetical protein
MNSLNNFDTEKKDELINSIKLKRGTSKVSLRSSIRPTTSLKKSVLKVKSLRLDRAKKIINDIEDNVIS